MGIKNILEHDKYYRSYGPYITKVLGIVVDISQFGFAQFSKGRYEESMW